MRNLLDELYTTKLQLIATLATVGGVSLLVLAHWSNGSSAWKHWPVAASCWKHTAERAMAPV